ncbi:MAG: tetratricopeptide repeat protein [Deltaproteobacteria bacterium]|nr:tetratricopeptide repeat protein [Candidatus Zymogenaceae bacterium]
MKKAIVVPIVAVILLLVIGCVVVQILTVSDGSAYRPGEEVVTGLKNTELIDTGDERTFGDGWLRVERDNYVLHLSGTPYEMGYQHGILMADEIAAGVLPIFSDPIGHNPSFADKPAVLIKLITMYLEITVYRPIEKNTPPEYLEEIAGIADGAGLSYRDVFVANFLSDLSMAMVPGVIAEKALDLGLAAENVAECSSFIAAGTATLDGSLVFGRNTDYSGQGRWGRYQTIFFYEPADGLRYVKISTAGLIKCNSAMNEAGIIVGGHFMAFDGARPDGVSFTVFENEIMRKAHTIDDALKILEDTPRGGCFALMIADGKDGRGVVAESSPEVLGVREMEDDIIALTNYATTDDLEPRDLMIRYNLVMRNLAGRHLRLKELLLEHHGKVTPELAARFMSDHHDIIMGRERGTGITVCSDNNVTSAVFSPGDGRFWVATGEEPACTNPYVGFDFEAGFSGEFTPVDPEILAGYEWEADYRREALTAYMEAYLAYTDDPANKETVLSYLAEAITIDPTEPIYYRMAGRILIHQGKYREALGVLSRSLEFLQSPNERAQTYLLLGQAYDMAGKRENAVTMYEEVIAMSENGGEDYFSSINYFVAALARMGMETPFTPEDLDTVPIAFSLESGFE